MGDLIDRDWEVITCISDCMTAIKLASQILR